MDFDDEVSSVSVDVADLMQATVLVMTGFIVSSVASQAVRRRDCSLLGVELIGLQCLALSSGTEPERDSSVRLISSSFSMIVDICLRGCLRVSSIIVGYAEDGSRSREC